jgi:sensory rhodopsin
MTPSTQAWFWLGAMGMMVGALYFGLGAYSARKLHNGRAEVVFQLTFFACLVAVALYLALASGYGAIEGTFTTGEGAGTRTVWARYVAWTLSTPLLITLFAYLGRSRLTTTTALLGTNAAMIGAGFLATLAVGPSKYLFFVLGLGLYAALAYLLLRPYREEVHANLPEHKPVMDRLIGAYLTLWALYPILWLLSPEGWHAYSSTMEASLFTIFDLALNVGFGLLAAATLAQLDGGEPIRPAELGRSTRSPSP